MDNKDLLARVAHDLGLAAWFGGTLMGAAGVNRASSSQRPGEGGQVSSTAWSQWTPINAAAIGMHLLGGTALTAANRGRLVVQHGAATTAIVKTGLTAAALAATAYARVLGQRLIDHGAPVEDPSNGASNPTVDGSVASSQERLRILQWAIPALTGAIIVVSSLMGEQQRPSSIAHGVLQRLHVPGV